MDVKTLVDAGPLIGWFNAADQWHEWSVGAIVARGGVLHTTEIVLGEALWHLGGNSAVTQALLTLVRGGSLVLCRPWPEHVRRTQELMLKYEEMDAADASLVVLSELYPKAALLTVDTRHFRVYRRKRNEALPLTAPE
jgi:hypothetical protein